MNICVFGAASTTIDKKYITAVEQMGEFLAKNGHNLVFGAGITGVMGAAGRGFKAGGGKIHGVIPEFFKSDLHEYVNWDCDELTITDSMRERKAVMEDLADAFVIAPGGAGTFEEFFEVMTLKQLGRHRKPIAIFNVDGYYNEMFALLDAAISKDFINEACRGIYKNVTQLDDLLDYVENDNMQGLTMDDLKK